MLYSLIYRMSAGNGGDHQYSIMRRFGPYLALVLPR